MKRFSWLSFVAVLSFLLHSCVHDEMYSASDPAAKEYHSKSLWKEDEIYIKNIIKIYEEHEAEIRKEHGTPLWEYAMTMDKFDESYLVVPVRKNGRIMEVMEVPRFGRKVYFRYSDDDEKVALFNQLMIDRPKKPLPVSSANAASKIVCVVKTFSTWYPDNENNPSGSGHWETSSYTICIDLTIDTFENPDDGGGNGGYDYPPFGGGYENPEDSIVVNQTPCEKLKAQTTNVNYKAKIEALDKSSILSLKKETGFAESKTGVFTDLPQAASTANSDGLTVTVTPSLKGYIHTHLNDYPTGKENENGEPEINQPIRMFSPADVNTLMSMAEIATDGNYSELYGTMVSSYGNYTIMFTGTAADIKTGFDTQKWTDDYVAYRVRNPYWSFEKLFLNFLKEKMNVQGVELYKIKDNGTVQKKTLNSNNNVQSSDCPQ
jgi:hypothetical protein